MKKVFILSGATATGKSALALDIAHQFGFEIINVDSAQVYIDMNIGTAKPSAEIQKQIPHHLLNLVTPENAYSAGQFLSDCQNAINDIFSRGKYPLLVGGTMLYIQSLLYGINNLPQADSEFRKQLEIEAEMFGWQVLHQRLCQIDPQSGQNIKPFDKQRIGRALEIFAVSGVPASSFYLQDKAKLPYKFYSIYLWADERKLLRERIRTRWAEMLKMGLLEEIIYLQQKYQLHENLSAMRCVGYRQLWQYLAEKNKNPNVDINFYNEKAIIATAQLAKRQMTWIKALVEKANVEYVDKPNSSVQLIIDYHLSAGEIKNKTSNFINTILIDG